jgi:hypothetical protein
MKREFTPAAERVLAEASHWSSGDGSQDLAGPALILGLLAENECRAAMVLAEHGIAQQEVCERWPRLTRRESAAALRFSADVEASLAAACERLGGFPRPLVLATEHLLLGLVAAQHESSLWLRQHGLAPDALEEQIYLLYGCSRDPLPFDEPVGGESAGSALPTVRPRISCPPPGSRSRCSASWMRPAIGRGRVCGSWRITSVSSWTIDT